jgi:hypothetical protein
MSTLGWRPIVDRCANPDCRNRFVHNTGELFLFEEDPSGSSGPSHTNNTRAVWLCENCCNSYTVMYDVDDQCFSVVASKLAS